MPAEQATQGPSEQAINENASTPAQDAPDKQTTTKQSELDAQLEISSEILAQLPKLEPDESEPQITPDPADAEPVEAAAEKKATDAKGEEAEKSEDDDSEEEEDQEHEDKGEKVDKRQKRINRLTRQKRELEDKLDLAVSEAEKLREEMESAGKMPASPTGKDASATWFPDEETAQTHSTLSTELEKQDAIIRWCNKNPNGSTTTEDGKEIFISPEEVAQWKSDAEEKRLRVSPEIAVIEREAKHAFRAQKSQNDDVSKKIWPELFDKSTQAYQFAQAQFRKYPSIKDSPEANWLLGVHLEGLAALEARRQKAKGNGNGADKPRRDISPRVFEPRVPIAPHTPEPPSREVTPSSTKRYNEAMSNLKNDPDGSAESLAKVFAAEDEMSRTRGGSRTPVKV